jgi:hypothetical protein
VSKNAMEHVFPVFGMNPKVYGTGLNCFWCESKVYGTGLNHFWCKPKVYGTYDVCTFFGMS